MPRCAKIRKKSVSKPKIIATAQKMETPVELIEITVDCMHKCGKNIDIKIDPKTIIPHLGRPRGLRKACHACAIKYSSVGLGGAASSYLR